MATTRIMPLHVGKGRTESRAISDIIDYVANPQKTDNGRLITGFACDSRTVNTDCDRKFRNFWGSTRAVRRLNDTICIENGLSIVENPKPYGKSYNKWLGDQAKPSHRELLRVAIDQALEQKPGSLDELLKLLQENGCEVSKRGKSYRLKLPDWDKAARIDSLGDGYRLEDLQAVLSGKKEHTPKKKNIVQTETPKVNLLVDIQAKLQAEYTKLLEEKKKIYAEYRRSREEMRELLTAKANVDRLLKMEVEQDVEKEKDHGQR